MLKACSDIWYVRWGFNPEPANLHFYACSACVEVSPLEKIGMRVVCVWIKPRALQDCLIKVQNLFIFDLMACRRCIVNGTARNPVHSLFGILTLLQTRILCSRCKLNSMAPIAATPCSCYKDLNFIVGDQKPTFTYTKWYISVYLKIELS